MPPAKQKTLRPFGVCHKSTDEIQPIVSQPVQKQSKPLFPTFENTDVGVVELLTEVACCNLRSNCAIITSLPWMEGINTLATIQGRGTASYHNDAGHRVRKNLPDFREKIGVVDRAVRSVEAERNLPPRRF